MTDQIKLAEPDDPTFTLHDKVAGNPVRKHSNITVNNIVDLVLIVGVVWLFLKITLAFWDDQMADEQLLIRSAVIASARTKNKEIINFEMIARSSPFRSELRVTDMQAPSRILPLTNLDITLKGIRLIKNGQSTIIIQLPDGEEQSFALGEEIMPNIKVSGVFIDHIEIDRQGIKERLYLDKPSQT